MKDSNKAPQERIEEKLFRILDPEETAGESGIGKIELGTFHEPFPEIPEVCPEKVDDTARFQDGNPRLDGIMAHAAIPCEIAQVQHLSRPIGAQADEKLEGSKLPDVDDRTHVVIDISAQVIPVPIVGLDVTVCRMSIEFTKCK